jgi:hypothetical protein
MSTFDDRQRAYMLSELNRAIPVGRASDMSTIQAALGTVDAHLPQGVRQVADAARMFSAYGGASNEALQRDASCRAIPAPSPSMRPDAGARAGCGWWYVPDPSTPSIGAYGTRRAPMNPSLDTQIGAGQWIWDPAQAAQMEGTKAAAQITSCPDIQYAQKRWPSMGWCTQTNMALLTDGQGNPLYPRTAGGDCAQGSIVMSAGACPAPSQPAAPGSSISAACGSGVAPLSPACLGSLATYSCGGNGALAQAYGGGGWPAQNDTTATTNQILMQRGFTLPTGVMQDGQIAVQDALSAFSALKAATADPTLDQRAQGAAANLCMGASFNPCAFQPTDNGPFPATCITQTALNMGYSPSGGLLPSNIGMNYWNTQLSGNQWSDVVSNLTYWKQTADTPQPQQPSLQTGAISNVYGVNIKPPMQGCNVNGAMVYRYYFPPGAVNYVPAATQYGGGGSPNPITHFLGRYLLTQGLDQGVPSDMNEMTPGNDQLTEIKRMLFSWTPAQGGIYRFLTAADDYLYVYFNGQMFAQNIGNTSGQLTQPTDDIVPGTPMTVQIDAINVGGPWNYQFTPQVSSDGGNTFQTVPLALTQMNMLYDRRLPMLEWAFHKMQPTNYGTSQLAAGVAIADTNGAMSQMSQTANIGSLNGRQCLVIGGPGQGLVNYGQQTLQGIRLMAMKSFTMMLCITGTQINPANNITPAVLSLYNLPTSKLRGSPNPGAWNPQFAQTYYNRTNSFDIMAQQSTLYPYGVGPLRGTSTPAQTYFQDAATSGNSITSYSQNQWFHLAWVWDADGTGYTIYLNGKQVGRGFMAPYDPQLIMEMFRLGCDQTADGNSWTGGIQWFRAFDYRLSQAQITLDMQDNWAAGLN